MKTWTATPVLISANAAYLRQHNAEDFLACFRRAADAKLEELILLALHFG